MEEAGGTALPVEDEALLFGLARLDRGADALTLDLLEHDTVFVAEVGGAPAGYVAIRRRGATACVEQLFVSPEHEAEGVGTRLRSTPRGSRSRSAPRHSRWSSSPRTQAAYLLVAASSADVDRLELILPRE